MWEKVTERTEAKELRGQDVGMVVVYMTVKINKNYDESGTELKTVTRRRVTREYYRFKRRKQPVCSDLLQGWIVVLY